MKKPKKSKHFAVVAVKSENDSGNTVLRRRKDTNFSLSEEIALIELLKKEIMDKIESNGIRVNKKLNKREEMVLTEVLNKKARERYFGDIDRFFHSKNVKE